MLMIKIKLTMVTLQIDAGDDDNKRVMMMTTK